MKELIEALALAQAEMKNAVFNKVNPHFKSRYADLSSIRDAIIPALAAQGIALVQAIEVREHGAVVVTKMLKNDSVLASECPVMVGDRVTPQQFGSALTYARRYALAAIACIAAEEDDDANEAEKTGGKGSPKTNGSPPKNLPRIIAPRRSDGLTNWDAFNDEFRGAIDMAPDSNYLGALWKSHAETLAKLEGDEPSTWHGLKEYAAGRKAELGGAA